MVASSFFRRRLRRLQSEDRTIVIRMTETAIATKRPMTSFFVSVEPTGELWEGEGDCETEDGVTVAVGDNATADSSGDDEGCLFGRLVLDRVKVDTRLDREDLCPSNWLTEQEGFKI